MYELYCSCVLLSERGQTLIQRGLTPLRFF